MSDTKLVTGDEGTDAAVVIAPPRTSTAETILRVVVPVAMLVLAVILWQVYVVVSGTPKYILPSPVDVWNSLTNDYPTLLPSLWVTLSITFQALILALVGGVALAILLVQSKWIELAVFPFAVILQVTPVIAIAPLLLIYTPNTQTALLIVAFLVAFFPILSNMVSGLKSVDHNLLNLFDLYGAGRWKSLIYLKIPASMPYFLTGLRIGGGLSLIAAVVAEFAAGSAGQGSGLAFRILESGYRLNIPAGEVAWRKADLAGIALLDDLSWSSIMPWIRDLVRKQAL